MSHKDRHLAELASANKAIADADALLTYEDGGEQIHVIDTDKMSSRFIEYYSGLVSAGYANGFI